MNSTLGGRILTIRDIKLILNGRRANREKLSNKVSKSSNRSASHQISAHFWQSSFREEDF
jgi:hypothetical protein